METGYIEVNRKNEDGLLEQTWRFYWRNDNLVLDFYGKFSRLSKRHKFQLKYGYSRLDSRYGLLKDVPITKGIIDEAIQKASSLIRVYSDCRRTEFNI